MSGLQNLRMFQSLIWVACPTGKLVQGRKAFNLPVSIPHMGCMPYGPAQPDPDSESQQYGFNPSYGLHALRATMNYLFVKATKSSFNPSYGLHALRAASRAHSGSVSQVSIPHMGCMPYGPISMSLFHSNLMFQSLIWVACPTGPI